MALSSFLVSVLLSWLCVTSASPRRRFGSHDAQLTARAKKQVLITYLPLNTTYYAKEMPDIVNFFKTMAQNSYGLDDFLILHRDDYTPRQVYEEVGSLGPYARCLEVPGELDLWTRDLGLTIPRKQVRFTYMPDYLVTKKEISDLKYINETLSQLFDDYHLTPTFSHIVLDGGNVVDNNKDKAIITERVVKDNRRTGESEEQAKQRIHSALEQVLGMKVAFIRDNHGTTGHADGSVTLIDDDVVLVTYFKENPADYEAVKKSILERFPSISVHPLPSNNVTSKWRHFDTADGIYVNSLVTNRAIYVPQFERPAEDNLALDTIKRRLKRSKKVVPIDVSKLAFMGGSVRCMTWQVDSDHPIAKKLWDDSYKCM